MHARAWWIRIRTHTHNCARHVEIVASPQPQSVSLPRPFGRRQSVRCAMWICSFHDSNGLRNCKLCVRCACTRSALTTRDAATHLSGDNVDASSCAFNRTVISDHQCAQWPIVISQTKCKQKSTLFTISHFSLSLYECTCTSPSSQWVAVNGAAATLDVSFSWKMSIKSDSVINAVSHFRSFIRLHLRHP